MWHREHLNHKEYLNNWLMPSAFVDQQSQDCTAPQTANNVVQQFSERGNVHLHNQYNQILLALKPQRPYSGLQ